MHNCPDCGQACYCGGDVDDIPIGHSKEESLCGHCSEADRDMDWDDLHTRPKTRPKGARNGEAGTRRAGDDRHAW